jgi:glycosyltransferase involved in cell wall biosynthesis
MLLSVLIPVFSEVDSLDQTVQILRATLPPQGWEILLLVHRDSSPACWQLCDRLATQPHIRVLRQQCYPGQGLAYREGIENAQGQYLLLMNSDLETEPTHAARLLEAIQGSDSDMVIASRWSQGARFDWRSYGLAKWVANFVVQKFFALLLGQPQISDLTFAYKIARAEVFKKIRWQGTGHEFVFEATVKPALLQYRLSEIPTDWIGRREGTSHQPLLRNLRHIRLGLRLILEHFLNPVQFRANYLPE